MKKIVESGIEIELFPHEPFVFRLNLFWKEALIEGDKRKKGGDYQGDDHHHHQ